MVGRLLPVRRCDACVEADITLQIETLGNGVGFNDLSTDAHGAQFAQSVEAGKTSADNEGIDGLRCRGLSCGRFGLGRIFLWMIYLNPSLMRARAAAPGVSCFVPSVFSGNFVVPRRSCRSVASGST